MYLSKFPGSFLSPSASSAQVLVRGGFLCEALEAISLAVPRSAWPRLQLEEFWSSEDYFFHDAAQMALVREMCPRMRKIMFQFSKEVMTDVLFLTSFDNLNELHLWVRQDTQQ